MNKTLKAGLIERIKREIDPSLLIVPQTTPVVFFGDYVKANVCTVSINPSFNEFLSGSTLLSGASARLCSRAELGIDKENHRKLTDDEAEKVLEGCINYFKKNPYKKWFDPFDDLIKRLSNGKYSYYNDTCVHLDLAQWATNKIWTYLSEGVQGKHLSNDKDTFKLLLDGNNFETMFLNGSTVLKSVCASLGVSLVEEKTSERFGEKKMPLNVFHGEYVNENSHKIKIVGWNLYLQYNVKDSADIDRFSRTIKGV